MRMQAAPLPLSAENQYHRNRCRLRPHFAVLTLWLVVLLSGCSTNTVAIVEPANAGERLGFLRDGETTRQEVLDRMGAPYGVNEADRALTYRVFENDLGKFVVAAKALPTPPYSRAEYSVTLIFDEKDVLKRHSLVFKGGVP